MAESGNEELKKEKKKKAKKNKDKDAEAPAGDAPADVSKDTEPKADAQEREGDESERQKRKWDNLCSIAKPLVTKKLYKRSLKLVGAAAKNKWQLKRGVKEVTKAVRKGVKGICLFAGDISPIDVISHLPILCEESNVPYAYVPSREDLGLAAATKRSTSVVMILEKPLKGEISAEELQDFKKEYDDIGQEFNEMAVLAFKK